MFVSSGASAAGSSVRKKSGRVAKEQLICSACGATENVMKIQMPPAEAADNPKRGKKRKNTDAAEDLTTVKSCTGCFMGYNVGGHRAAGMEFSDYCYKYKTQPEFKADQQKSVEVATGLVPRSWNSSQIGVGDRLEILSRAHLRFCPDKNYPQVVDVELPLKMAKLDLDKCPDPYGNMKDGILMEEEKASGSLDSLTFEVVVEHEKYYDYGHAPLPPGTDVRHSQGKDMDEKCGSSSNCRCRLVVVGTRRHHH